MHSAFATGSPVKVRTIRIAASFAIAGAIRSGNHDASANTVDSVDSAQIPTAFIRRAPRRANSCRRGWKSSRLLRRAK
jgi:hypothetical protein